MCRSSAKRLCGAPKPRNAPCGGAGGHDDLFRGRQGLLRAVVQCDLDLLAGRIDLPGGNIRNIALGAAVLAAEDDSFYWHPGVSPTGIARDWIRRNAWRRIGEEHARVRRLATDVPVRPDRKEREVVRGELDRPRALRFTWGAMRRYWT